MTRLNFNQKGFEAVGLLVAVVIVAAIGLVGYKVMNTQKSASKPAVASSQPAVKEPAQLKTKADLTATSKALDQSASELNNELNDSALDSDVNALL
jgi:uncharacterized protein HemX